MDNEEIIRRIKLHNSMFSQYDDCVEDKGIVWQKIHGGLFSLN